MDKQTYKELLLDPRWQRKRNSILDRDDYTCQRCGCTTKNLQVHHLKYEKDKLPWEYDDKYLVTLCVDCHNQAHKKKKPVNKEVKVQPTSTKNSKTDGKGRTEVARVCQQAAEIVYTFTTIKQVRCWTLIVEALQKYVGTTVDTPIVDWADITTIRSTLPLNENNELIIPIDFRRIIGNHKGGSKAIKVIKELEGVMVEDTGYYGQEQPVPLLNGWCRNEQTGQPYVKISVEIVYWFIHLMNGNYTVFHIESLLSLSSISAMRLYLYLSDHVNVKRWKASLLKFKKRLNIQKDMNYGRVAQKILQPALKEFESKKTKVSFTYKPVYPERVYKRGRPTAATIEFTCSRTN